MRIRMRGETAPDHRRLAEHHASGPKALQKKIKRAGGHGLSELAGFDLEGTQSEFPRVQIEADTLARGPSDAFRRR